MKQLNLLALPFRRGAGLLTYPNPAPHGQIRKSAPRKHAYRHSETEEPIHFIQAFSFHTGWHCMNEMQEGKQRRQGTNLIELVVVLSLQAVLLAAGVGLIGRMLQAEQTGRAGLEALHGIDALADQFRQDVHAARDVALAQDHASAVLQLPLGTVTYEVKDGRMTRVEREGATLRHSQAYRLPTTWKFDFEKLEDPPQARICLTISAESADKPSKRRSISCEALLGRDVDQEAMP